ncbi:MAG: type IV fimbrial assembly protein PilB [Planctomycetota bacterium]|nr:MAG: type IV fimbrial assembly protein PilB [Planctomycetota bacterium]
MSTGGTAMMAHKRLGEILQEMDLVTEAEIDEARRIQKERGGLLGEILIELGYITDKDLLFALGAQSGMEVIDLDEVEVPAEVIEMVPVNYCETYTICPVSFDGKTLVVALADPLNVSVLDDLRFLLNCEVQGAVSTAEAVERAIKKYYAGQTGDSLAEILQELGTEDVLQLEEGGGYSLEDLEKQANSTPVVKLLNLILLQAIKDRASDIHIEPFENELKVRYRIDGVLYEMMPPPAHLAPALASRVKVMAKLDISETRLPQDGRIELNIGGRPVDLRVSTLPTMFGESVVMRILDRSNVSLDLDRIGLRPDEYQILTALLEKPNGIILVTGPTGSGKTTTLYSCLNKINSPVRKIITTEDPVEYDLEGIVQVQINEEIGLTYAECLRSILRQDPDVILVGEIRDLETAQIAIEAALTGHLVLSTLHTNDAPSVVTRMIDLGVPPYLLAATLEAVIAQRLVRTICEECRVEYEPSEEELYELDLSPEAIGDKRFYYGKGCRRCNNSGYKGRMAIFEIMLVGESLKQMIIDGASTGDLREAARREGMRLLRESGLLAIYDGRTTFEEVVKETVLA